MMKINCDYCDKEITKFNVQAPYVDTGTVLGKWELGAQDVWDIDELMDISEHNIEQSFYKDVKITCPHCDEQYDEGTVKKYEDMTEEEYTAHKAEQAAAEAWWADKKCVLCGTQASRKISRDGTILSCRHCFNDKFDELVALVPTE